MFAPDAVEQIIAPTVNQILTTARGEVVSIGFLLSLWSGSSAMSSFVDAITRAHDQYERRNLVWQRCLAVLMYMVGALLGHRAAPDRGGRTGHLLALLPAAVQPLTRELVDVLYWPVLTVTLVVALTTLYKIALPYKPPWWRGLPGAVAAAVVFLAGATGLRLYLTWLTGTGYTYGALAAPTASALAAGLQRRRSRRVRHARCDVAGRLRRRGRRGAGRRRLAQSPSSARNRRNQNRKTTKSTIACSAAIVTPASCWSSSGVRPQTRGRAAT